MTGFDAVAWLMLVARTHTATLVVEKLHSGAKAIVASAEVQRQLIELGVTPINSSLPPDLGRYIGTEMARWAKVVQHLGLAGSE